MPARVFLLSPAHAGGARAQLLLAEGARSDLAARLRTGEGAPLGEVFAFCSALYFRGKLAYARAFARPAPGQQGVLVITPHAGLWSPERPVTLETLRIFAGSEVARGNAAYRAPLMRDARALARRLGGDGEAVLLGSLASSRYVEVLAPILGQRLLAPACFVGRGDMSRGGLLLRAVRSGVELDCSPVLGLPRHGAVPPRLEPLAPRAGAGGRRR